MFQIPTKTTQDYAKEALIAINAHAINFLENKKQNYMTGFLLVWQPQNCTPQDIFDLMGTNAVELFQKAGVEAQSILALDPTWKLPMPGDYEYPNYKINEDGSVIAGEKVVPVVPELTPTI